MLNITCCSVISVGSATSSGAGAGSVAVGDVGLARSSSNRSFPVSRRVCPIHAELLQAENYGCRADNTCVGDYLILWLTPADVRRSRVCAGWQPPSTNRVNRMGVLPATRAYRELVARTRDHDACPGALQVHPAADGALARVRLPGGMITAPQLEALAARRRTSASPAMELTSRGNIQIRGITDTERRVAGVRSRRRACCPRTPTSGYATSSPRRCPAGSGRRRTSAGWSVSWTPRFRRSPRWPACPADSCSASTTGAATSADWRPTRASTSSATRPHCYWPAATPASASRWTTRSAALWPWPASFADIRGTCWRIANSMTRAAAGRLPGDGGARRDMAAGDPAARSAGSRRTTGGWPWAPRFRSGFCRPAWPSTSRRSTRPWSSRRGVRCSSSTSTKESPMSRCGCWRRWGWCSTRTRRGCRSAHAPAALDVSTRPPTSAPMPRPAIDEPATGHRHFVGCERACGSPPGR